MKLKMDHDAKQIKDVFAGETVDMDKFQDIWEAMLADPQAVFGEKKSLIIDYIVEAVESEDKEKLLALAMVTTRGLEAIIMVKMMYEKAAENLKGVDPMTFPPEIREKLREEGIIPKDTKEIVVDEFERLRAKYTGH